MGGAPGGGLAHVVCAHCRKPACELVATIFEDPEKYSTTTFDEKVG